MREFLSALWWALTHLADYELEYLLERRIKRCPKCDHEWRVCG